MYAPRQIAPKIDDRSNLPVVVLSLWIVASAVFGGYFWALRVPGIFDITIERLLFSVILLLLVAGLFQGKVIIQKNIAIEIAMGMFLLVCLLSMTRTGFFPIIPGLPAPWFNFINGYLFPFFIFVFAKNYHANEKDVLVILHTLFYFGIYLCILSILEFFNLLQFVVPRYIADPLLGIHMGRARGPFLNAAFNGVGIVIGFISGLHLLQKKTGFSRFFYLSALLLFFPAVFFTLTRAVYLAMLITVIIFLVWYKTSLPKWKLISLPLVIVLIVGIANYPRLLSTERREGGVYQVKEVAIRFALMERSVYLFSGSPFTGIGLAQFVPESILKYRGPVPSFAPASLATFQHNHFLGVMTELGLPGILIYLTIIIQILRRVKQLKGKLPETGIMGNNLRIVIFAVWSVFISVAMTAETTNFAFVNAIPMLFAGLADGLYTRSLQPGLASPSFVSQSHMRISRSYV